MQIRRWSLVIALLTFVSVTGAMATAPCLPNFDDPLTEFYRSSGGDLRVATAGIGSEDGAREIIIDVPGTPVAAWIYWVGEIRADGGMPDEAITLDGGALPGATDLFGFESGRRHQVFSDETSSGCAGNGGEVAMRAEVPLYAFVDGVNNFIVTNFNEKSAPCGGNLKNTYRRQFGLEMVVVYEGTATCAAGAAGSSDDNSSDDSSSDDSSWDDDSSDDDSYDDDSSDDDSSSDDGSSDDDSSDDDNAGGGNAACQREVILLEGGDVASRSPFSREPNCDVQTSTEIVCFDFAPLACDSTAELTFGLGGTAPMTSIVGNKERLASQEKTWFAAATSVPVSLIGTSTVLETNRLIDANFYYAGRKMSVYSGEVSLSAGDDTACFQVELLDPLKGEQAQHTILFDATLSLDRTCEAGGNGDPGRCDDDSSDDDSSDDSSSDDDSSDDDCDDSSSDDDSSDDDSSDDDSSDDSSSDDD